MYNFLSIVPFRFSKMTATRKSKFREITTLFRAMTKIVSTLFREIRSERNSETLFGTYQDNGDDSSLQFHNMTFYPYQCTVCFFPSCNRFNLCVFKIAENNIALIEFLFHTLKDTVRSDWICMRVVSLESPLKGHQPLYVFNFLFLILNI
jgi:hypothetical protein